jgi:phosphohistidine phosphatase SixA
MLTSRGGRIMKTPVSMNKTQAARLAPVLVGVAVAFGGLHAQERSPNELVRAIQSGGCVLVMRHASSPREAPAKGLANSDNTKLERQLDEAGRRGATAMGEALRALRIPIGIVLTSPTYRAMETVRLARLDSPTIVNELGDGGQSMQGASETQAAWLRTKVTEVPRSGNTVLVTHQPNLSRAFPDWGSTVLDGETVIIRPDGKGGIRVIGRIEIDDWSRLRGLDRN